jgi:hypothetical protein
MVCFQTKNTNLGKFWRALDWNILWRLGKFYDFLVIWYIFPVLVSCTKKNLATLVPFSKAFHNSHSKC